MIIEFNNKKPKIGAGVFIAPTAVVIGDVTIMDRSSIWYGAVLRGDMSPITVGMDSNIQDNCTVHTDEVHPTIIGNKVTVGHNVVLHGCEIFDSSLIGMGAVIMNGARVGEGSIIGAGALVKEGMNIGPHRIAAGNPAVVLKKEINKGACEALEEAHIIYGKLAKKHMHARKLEKN